MGNRVIHIIKNADASSINPKPQQLNLKHIELQHNYRFGHELLRQGGFDITNIIL